MKNDYLSVISKRIKDKNTQKQIYSELEGHIQDKIMYYKELGYSDDEAEKRAAERESGKWGRDLLRQADRFDGTYAVVPRVV